MAIKYSFPEIKLQTPDLLTQLTPKLTSPLESLFPPPQLKPPPLQNPYTPGTKEWMNFINQEFSRMNQDWKQTFNQNNTQSGSSISENSTSNKLTAAGINALSSQLSGLVTDGMFGDSDIGRGISNIFSQGISSATDTMANNVLKGTSLTQGLGQNVGQSIQGAALGTGANLIGRGINTLGGDTKLSRGIGQGVATGLANAPGIIKGVKQVNDLSKQIRQTTQTINQLKQAGIATNGQSILDGLKGLKGAQLASLGGIGMGIAGTALGAALGPSKEYSGKYGNITQIADTAYDAITTGVNFIPGVGQVISGALALNKGLSNLFGSTDGMTVQDAILGSAFMPAPVKWLNMWGANTTSSFNNQSWQNSEKTKSFMGNAFGNLQDKFDQAKEEAGKTYGLFSQGAYSDAQKNINFANRAWDQVLAMADQNELQNIRSQYMSSINNQRYAQDIQGGWSPLARGKYGMKILNNATNHNIGMRLLSGAALIDNKQMILCSVVD